MKKLTIICFVVAALSACESAEADNCESVTIHTENGPVRVLVCK